MNKFDANDLRNRVAMVRASVDAALGLNEGETSGFRALTRAVEQLADTVDVLVDALYEADRSARVAADTASMLANGIQPD